MEITNGEENFLSGIYILRGNFDLWMFDTVRLVRDAARKLDKMRIRKSIIKSFRT